jgi:hypothetical protein
MPWKIRLVPAFQIMNARAPRRRRPQATLAQ